MARIALRLVLLSLLGSPAAALDPERTLGQYHHRLWTAKDGAPPLISVLVEGQDGYIWMASALGLYRFDGVTFEHIGLADRQEEALGVTAVLPARDGAIWVGYRSGIIAIYRDGQLRVDAKAPRGDHYVSGFTQTRDGAIWATFPTPYRSVHRYANGRWTAIGADWGLPHSAAGTLIAARDGSLWLMAQDTIFRLPPNGLRFQRVGAALPGTAMAEDKQGRIWLSDRNGLRVVPPLFPDQARTISPLPPFTFFPSIIQFDRDGNLWGLPGHGLFRVRAADKALALTPAKRRTHIEPIFDKRDGLSSDSATAFLEDREGNIWIGTTLGLDQFRDAAIVTEPAFSGKMPRSGFGLFSASDGTIYIGTTKGAYRVRPGGQPEKILSAAGVYQICEGPDGSIWAAVSYGIYRLAGGRSTFQGGMPSGHNYFHRDGCVLDRDNVLWLSNTEGGLFRLSKRMRWIRYPPTTDAEVPLSMTRGSNGRPIALLNSGEIVGLDEQGRPARLLFRAPSRDIGFLYQGEDGVYLGSPSGISRWRNGRLEALSAKRFSWLAEVMEMVQTRTGQTWMIGLAGIVRLPTAALDRAFTDPAEKITPLILGPEDGLPDLHTRNNQHGVVQGGDGRLWFTTIGNISWVDPERLYRNALPPAVHIASLTAGDTRYRDPSHVILAEGTSSLAIRYAGLSMTAPERVSFRYRLEGVDSDWINAGGRREAYYSNLGAGTYQFQVMAANNDGVWNDEAATVDIIIPPTFTQSIWFTLLCLSGAGLLLWLLYRFRVGRVKRQVQRLFEVRLAERERIARELHDTLLQSVYGLLIFLQSLVPRVSVESGLREPISQALDHAEGAMAEGRDRVARLRGDTATRNLARALREISAELVPATIAFTLNVDGTPRPIQAVAAEEIARIAEEAIRNAVLHASASRIDAVIAYGTRRISLTIADDGVGIPQNVLTAGGRSGHFGLVGMRERAALIGGRIVWDRPGETGVRVVLTVPAASAYAGRHRPWAGWLSRLLGRQGSVDASE